MNQGLYTNIKKIKVGFFLVNYHKYKKEITMFAMFKRKTVGHGEYKRFKIPVVKNIFESK